MSNYTFIINNFIFLSCLTTSVAYGLESRFVSLDDDFNIYLQRITLYKAQLKKLKPELKTNKCYCCYKGFFKEEIKQLYQAGIKCKMNSIYKIFEVRSSEQRTSSVLNEAYKIAKEFGDTKLLEVLLNAPNCKISEPTIVGPLEPTWLEYALPPWDIITHELEIFPDDPTLITLKSIVKAAAIRQLS